MAGAGEPDAQIDINELSNVECHVRWLQRSQETDTEEISRLKEILDYKVESEPWLQALHCVSLAYMAFIEEDEQACNDWLVKAEEGKKEASKKKPAVPLLNVRYLIAAMRTHLMLKFHSTERAKLQEMLNGLFKKGQKSSTRAAVSCAKGWVMLSCVANDTEALSAFRETINEKSASKSSKFFTLYGLALIMVRRERKADLSAEIGEERLELWEEAHKIYQQQNWQQPVFLAQYAEAIAYTVVHSTKCEFLARDAFDIAKAEKQFKKCLQVYVILPKVYRALKKLKKWGERELKHNDERIRNESKKQQKAESKHLSDREKAILDAGEKIYLTATDETLKSDFAFQFALYYIKTKTEWSDQADRVRYNMALEWLEKVDPSNIWARIRRLSIRESLLELEDTAESADEYQSIKSEYEELVRDNSIHDHEKLEIRFEFGRFLVVSLAKISNPVEDQFATGCKHMREAMKTLPSLRFISKYKKRRILECPALQADKAEYDWFSEMLDSTDYVGVSHFPKSMYSKNYKWRLGCRECTSMAEDGSYQVTQLAGEHECNEELLLVTERTSQFWQLIRERTGDDKSEKAANKYEQQLWKLEDEDKFYLAKFLKQVRQRRP